MAKLRSITLRNYRRFNGEIELPLDPGVTLITAPLGKGKTTILEAISWCLLGTELVAEPDQVPNVEVLGKGMTEVLVGLTFVHGERLERFALFSCVSGEVEQEAWGWRLVDAASGATIAEGDDPEEFADHQERLFPETCVHANLIDGPGLSRTLTGGPGGVERAVDSSRVWCTSDLSLRSSFEATSLFHALCPDAAIDIVGYGPDGRPELSVSGAVPETEVRAALLCHSLAFAKENAKVCPIFLDEPFGQGGPEDRTGLFDELIGFLPGRQLVFLLSDGKEVHSLRATGRVDRELEIWG